LAPPEGYKKTTKQARTDGMPLKVSEAKKKKHACDGHAGDFAMSPC